MTSRPLYNVSRLRATERDRLSKTGRGNTKICSGVALSIKSLLQRHKIGYKSDCDSRIRNGRSELTALTLFLFTLLTNFVSLASWIIQEG